MKVRAPNRQGATTPGDFQQLSRGTGSPPGLRHVVIVLALFLPLVSMIQSLQGGNK